MTDIVTWSQSKFGFYVDRWYDVSRSKWILEPRPIQLAPYHADLLRHVFTPDDEGRLPYDTVGWCEPAKSGKSAVAALVAEYMGLHLDQNSVVVMASSKRDQAASIMFRSLTDSVDLNPYLPHVESAKYELTFSGVNNTVRAIPSNSKGEAGQRYSLAVFDELWSYMHTDAQRLFSEFKPDPTRLNSVRLCVGYAGYVAESRLWEDLLTTGLKGRPVDALSHIVNDDGRPTCYANGRHFVFWSHTPRQPWQDERWLASMRASLSAGEFERMVHTQFVAGLGNFVDQADWESLIDPDHKPLSPGTDTRVYVGLDIATAARGDDCACVAVYPEDGRVKVAWHQVWHGKDRRSQLKLTESVLPFLLGQNQRYKLAGVWYDPHQSLQLAEELSGAGIRTIDVQQTHSTRGPKDTALLELATSGRLVLYDHDDLRSAAAGANAQELGNGLIFLKKSGRLKIDLLVALSNCADEALRAGRVGRAKVITIYTDRAGRVVAHDESGDRSSLPDGMSVFDLERQRRRERWLNKK